MKSKTAIFIFFLLGLFFFDQVSKSWARGLEMPRPGDETIVAVYPMINERGFLGLFPALPELLVAFLAVASIYIIARHYRQEITPLAALAFAFFLAGIFGNTIDRLLFGHVTDWLFLYPGIVLNFADIFILLGSVATILFLLSTRRETVGP